MHDKEKMIGVNDNNKKDNRSNVIVPRGVASVYFIVCPGQKYT